MGWSKALGWSVADVYFHLLKCQMPDLNFRRLALLAQRNEMAVPFSLG
jgi:hypothetical protein